MEAPAASWTRTVGPGGAVRFVVSVPASRRRGLAVWAVAQACVLVLLTMALGAATILCLVESLHRTETLVFLLFVGGPFVLVAPRVPGAVRLAMWRHSGRETIDIAAGEVRVRREPASSAGSSACLDTSGGAFVGVVGEVDTFYVRATRWRTGRWFRVDDVPGLGVGSVRLATAGESALVGLSLTLPEAAALAAELAALPGFAADRCAVPRGG